jgi:GNAT superfamily N-acetyltransferase
MQKRPSPETAKTAPAEFAIRHACPEDAPAIRECLGLAFEPYRSLYTPEAYLGTVLTPDRLMERLRSMTVFVALDAQNNLVGTIGGGAVSAWEGHLRGMAVPPLCHGRGIARLLLEAMEKYLRNEGCRRISLDTTEPLQRAIRFYERNNYRPTGKVTDFFGMPLIEYAKHL